MLILIVATSMTYADSTPEGTPISTAEQLFAIQENGIYYLANDIDLSAYPDKVIENTFKGTIDGNGYKITNFTMTKSREFGGDFAGLFLLTNNATFKNLTLENVNIDIQLTTDYAKVGAVTPDAVDCTFSNVKVSGKINLTCISTEKQCMVGGIFGIANSNITITGCENAVDISVNGVDSVEVSGLGSFNIASFVEVSNCKNSGNITVIKTGIGDTDVAGLIAFGRQGNGLTMKSCKNTGDITVNIPQNLKCSYSYDVAGVCTYAEEIFKCSNTGTVKVAGKLANSYIYVAGISIGDANKIDQSYNTGKIYVNASSAPEIVTMAGIYAASRTYGRSLYVKNSYNIGKIIYKGKTNSKKSPTYIMSGIVGRTDDYKVSCCYNTGTITGPKQARTGAIVQERYEGKISNNYYTKGANKFKSSQVKKVTKITKSQCPKLSSKYWVYSKAKGRMILKNNKEK